MKLWYREPAHNWNEALPIGNGKLGGMVFGDPVREQIQLNEESVWSGSARQRLNPDAQRSLPAIRGMLRNGRIQTAQELAKMTLSGMPESQRAYQTLGDLMLEFDGIRMVQDYRRELDLDDGTVRISFSSGETRYSREMFCSAPDQVIAFRFRAEGPKKLTFRSRLVRPMWPETIETQKPDRIWMSGCTGHDGIEYCAMLQAGKTDGVVSVLGEYLCVQNATYAELYLTAATSYQVKQPEAVCSRILDQSAERGYDRAQRRHQTEYQTLYHSMSLTLGNQTKDEIPTDERLEHYRQGGKDPSLEALYFAYGRYLLLSSSRRGSLPANLQGIWNDQMDPPWGSRYTININIETNYWAACSCGLAKCEEPLFAMLRRMDSPQTGQKTAREMYGCRGFVAHHNTDLYADTAPQDQYIPATYWVMGAAWLCTHIWRHYTYTHDRALLEKTFDILADSVRFFADFLETDEEGYLVTNPSVSPENTYRMPDGTQGCLCIGPTMDNQILRELLDGFIKAGKLLHREESLVQTAQAMREKLRPTQIGEDGRLLEWRYPYEEVEPGHRHISHLYGLYPGGEITPDTPSEFEAARKTLEARLASGGGHTGWSRAWIIGLWASLRDGEKAHENIRALLSQSTFPNLMDSHPWKDGATFQIDGNLGAVAAFAELLAYSNGQKVQLLPALPEEWSEGEVDGLRLRGNLLLCMKWKNSRLCRAELTAGSDADFRLVCGENSRMIHLKQGETVLVDETMNKIEKGERHGKNQDV